MRLLNPCSLWSRSRLLPLAMLATLGQAQTQGLIGGEPRDGHKWPSIEAPVGNPFEESAGDPFQPQAGSVTEKRRVLGKMLFWDEQASVDGTMACGTCHMPEAGGTDLRPTVLAPNGKLGALGMVPQAIDGGYRQDVGLQQGRRVTGFNPPSSIGAGFFNQLFWELRAGPGFESADDGVLAGFEEAAALEALSVMPIVSPVEMAHDGMTWESGEIQAKLGIAQPLQLATQETIPADLMPTIETGLAYADLFDEAFASDPLFGGSLGVTRERFAMVLATYQRTLVPNQAKVDTEPLDEEELAGFLRMRINGCFGCHSSTGFPVLGEDGGFVEPMDNILSDGLLHLVDDSPVPMGQLEVKTPSLRNSALKRNLYHNGSKGSIVEAIDFLNGETGNVSQDVAFIPPLDEHEKQEVLAFFDALVDPRVASASFPFDRPKLYSERVPFESNLFGSGTPSYPGGNAPQMIANAPLVSGSLGNKVGLAEGPLSGLSFLHVSMAAAAGPLAFIDTNSPNYLGNSVVSIQDDGHATFVFTSPPSVIVGQTLFVQWATIDAEGVGAISRAASMLVH